MSDPVRVFVGCAASGEDAESCAVLEYSIRSNTARDVDIVWMMQSKGRASFWSGWNTAKWAST